MAGTMNDPLSPATKDPAEGARGPARGGDEGGIEASKLRSGGDPVEGRTFDDESDEVERPDG